MFVGARAGTAQDESDDTGRFCRQLQSPGRGEGEFDEFANHTGKPAMAQPFFHRRQNFSILPGLAIDHAIWMQADARKGRGEEIAAVQTPDYRTRQTRENARGEQSSKRRAGAVRPLLTDLVQGTKSEPAAGQPLIDLLDAEGERLPLGRNAQRHPVELLTKRANDR